MSTPTPEQRLANYLACDGYLRQGKHLASWHPENLYPDRVRNTLTGRRKVWRQVLDTPYSEATWQAAFLLLPEVPPLVKLVKLPDHQVEELRKRLVVQP